MDRISQVGAEGAVALADLPLASVSPTDRAAASGAEARVNLFGLDRAMLRTRFEEMGESAYRADQVMQWIYQRGVDDFERMSNLSKALRTRLHEQFVIVPPETLSALTSTDGTRKWALRVGNRDGVGATAIETVFIPEASRGTLCISSQAGCAMDCSFCSTAQQGFSRNLTAAEIIAQVWFAERTLADPARADKIVSEQRSISNVVFMGMGEPLANYNQLIPAIRILLDDFGFGLSKRRVTVSTSGLVPFIDRLRDDVDTALAVSLHASNDELRDELVPINRKYPLTELMQACRRYTQGKDRKAHIVYEYVMLDGINDSAAQARDLARLLGAMPAKVNLIPFNPFPQSSYRRSPAARIGEFAEILRKRRIITTVRRTRGDDIDAACGQLVGRVQSRQARRLGDSAARGRT